LADATRDLDIGLVVLNAGGANPVRFTDEGREELAMTLRLSALAHAELALHFGRNGLDGFDLAADLDDDAAILMTHVSRAIHRLEPAIRLQVGPADATGREFDDGVGWLQDCRIGYLLAADVAYTVKHGRSHIPVSCFPSSRLHGRLIRVVFANGRAMQRHRIAAAQMRAEVRKLCRLDRWD
jgi:hypothetical protein